MEETFVLQKPFGHSGRVELGFTPQDDLQHEDQLAVHRYGRTGDRDALVKTAVSRTGTKVLRREADAYNRMSGKHTAFGRLLGFRTAQDPVCLMVTRRGVPISRCDPKLRLDATQLDRAARDLFGALATLADLGFAHRAVSADSVFWDGLQIQLQNFGHVEPLFTIAGLHESALGSPTGLPVSDVPDARAAALLLCRLATGSADGRPATALGRLADAAPRLAEALEPALLADVPPTPKEMAERLQRSRPVQRRPAQEGGQERPGTDERHVGLDAHRREFRELRRQQREFNRAGAKPRRAGAAEQARAAARPAAHAAQAAGSEPSPPEGGSRSWFVFGLFALVAVLLFVLVVR
ncbi:hypothetical protein BZB76_1099 [Actinomadura pelletieri DSM 43383]|uniref:Protein kinase domain-containing protein n=1 Tax=Actinomadura pelletieri DSM 43383 TaxID=1120940 RepID=A0A495R084_9ACTN|nr:hypothetical protein [Actinomadura pelletieri]RKS79624.1 hypothetical protein BZB76_1099 [Actinomadura pelletieri DSM 43383]